MYLSIILQMSVMLTITFLIMTIREFKDGDYQKRILNIYDYNYYYGSKIESGEVAIEKGGQL